MENSTDRFTCLAEDDDASLGVFLLRGNRFENNSADIQGGAISYRSQGIEEEKQQGEEGATIYIGNTARIYSNTTASFVSQLQIVYDESREKEEDIHSQSKNITRIIKLAELKNATVRASLQINSSTECGNRPGCDAQRQLDLLQAAADRREDSGSFSDMRDSTIVEVPSG